MGKKEKDIFSQVQNSVEFTGVGPGTHDTRNYGNAHVEVLHNGSLRRQKFSREIRTRRVINVYGLSIYYGLGFSQIIFPAQEEI